MRHVFTSIVNALDYHATSARQVWDVNGSSFAASVNAFDDCAIAHVIGCPELKYDDGGLCAC